MQGSHQIVYFNEAGKLVLNPDGGDFLSNLKQRHSIISVTGPYRTGKSFILNLLTNTSSFAVGSKVQACTDGIWIHQVVLKKQSYLFLDVEGFGSTNRSSNHDAKLFALALSISSLVIYNSLGVINESKVNHLALALSYCQMTNQQFSGLSDPPHLIWLLRDFILELTNVEGDKISSNEYLENTLKDKRKEKESAIRMRETILTTFPVRSCLTLPRPADEESDLQNIDINNIKPEFLKTFKKLQTTVFETPPKQFQKKYVRGKDLLGIIKVMVDALNSDSIPQIPSAWNSIIIQEYEDLAEKYSDEQEKLLSELRRSFPLDDTAIINSLQKFKEKVEQAFIECHFCDEKLTRKFISKFSKNLEEEVNILIMENRSACLEFNISLLNSLFPALFIAIENNEYESDIDRLEIEWSNLMEQFESRAKGNAKLVAIAEFSKRNHESELGKLLNDVVIEMNSQIANLRNQERMMSYLDKGMEGKTNEEIMTEIICNRYRMQEFNKQVRVIQKNVLKKL